MVRNIARYWYIYYKTTQHRHNIHATLTKHDSNRRTGWGEGTWEHDYGIMQLQEVPTRNTDAGSKNKKRYAYKKVSVVCNFFAYPLQESSWPQYDYITNVSIHNTLHYVVHYPWWNTCLVNLSTLVISAITGLWNCRACPFKIISLCFATIRLSSWSRWARVKTVPNLGSGMPHLMHASYT